MKAADPDTRAALSYYNLRAKPFQPSTDPKFLWLSEQHTEVLAALKAGVLQNAGLLLLTGDVGTGKTTLTNALVSSLGDDVSVARLDYPSLEPVEFFGVIAQTYNLSGVFVTREAFLLGLAAFLNDAHSNKIGRAHV